MHESGGRSLSGNQNSRRMSGGHAVALSLRNEGVRHAFSVPGESYIALLDGLRDVPEITLITNRHEGSACLMAEGYGKTTRTAGSVQWSPAVPAPPTPASECTSPATTRRRWSCSSGRWRGPIAAGSPARRSTTRTSSAASPSGSSRSTTRVEVPRIMARAFHVARVGAARPGGGLPPSGHA